MILFKQKFFLISFLCLPLIFLSGCNNISEKRSENNLIRLSTTTSVQDSGLLPELEKIFEQESNYDLDIIANGTGAAIKLGQTGDADVLLVHAKSAEEEFVDSGFGVERMPFMHNYFIIAGDKTDPAKIANKTSASEAFIAIAENQSSFVSRGDNSGTHKAELKIWTSVDLEPVGDWYIEAGKGMGPCLIMAGELEAYILTDKATWLATRDQHKLEMIIGASEDLKNIYSVIAVSKEKNPDVNYDGAAAWIDFLKSETATEIINNFGKEKYGEALFIYDGFDS